MVHWEMLLRCAFSNVRNLIALVFIADQIGCKRRSPPIAVLMTLPWLHFWNFSKRRKLFIRLNKLTEIQESVTSGRSRDSISTVVPHVSFGLLNRTEGHRRHWVTWPSRYDRLYCDEFCTLAPMSGRLNDPSHERDTLYLFDSQSVPIPHRNVSVGLPWEQVLAVDSYPKYHWEVSLPDTYCLILQSGLIEFTVFHSPNSSITQFRRIQWIPF